MLIVVTVCFICVNLDLFLCQVAMSTMKRQYQTLLQVEKLAAAEKKPVPLLEALRVVITPAVRLMYLAFEEYNFNSNSMSGRHVLQGLLNTFPDSKLIEDIHGVIRNDASSQKTRRQTVHHLQELVTNCKQLSSRDIPHNAEVGRDVFVREFPHTRDAPRKRRLVGLLSGSVAFFSAGNPSHNFLHKRHDMGDFLFFCHINLQYPKILVS